MRLLVLLLLALSTGCGDTGARAYPWLELPEHFPDPVVPEEHEFSPERAELGRHLFYDRRLSGNGEIACSSCHRQEHAFADQRALSLGATGEEGVLNAPSLANAAYFDPLTWSRLSTHTIEEQLLLPMFGETPVEMGMKGSEAAIAERLQRDPRYRELFRRAFPQPEAQLDVKSARIALAAFVRSIVSHRSEFDVFLRGDESALAGPAGRGADLFYSDRLGCGGCHAGYALTAAARSTESSGARISPFHNVGLYNLDDDGAYPDAAPGLFAETGIARDRGRFRIPSLRNVALTGPYMHDGSVTTLEEVVRIYERGGRSIERGPLAGDGSDNPHRSRDLRTFELTDDERADLLAFLESLTDRKLVEDQRYADPW